MDMLEDEERGTRGFWRCGRGASRWPTTSRAAGVAGRRRPATRRQHKRGEDQGPRRALFCSVFYCPL